MSRWEELVVIAGFFVLRLGIPLAITIVLAWFLRRLDSKWALEAERQREQENQPATTAVSAEPKPSPCWVVKGCPEEVYRNCPAHILQTLPCWVARIRVEGRMPALCANCALFRARAATPS